MICNKKSYLTLSPTIFVLHCSFFRSFPQCHPFWEPTPDPPGTLSTSLLQFIFLFLCLSLTGTLYMVFYSSTSAKNNYKGKSFLFMVSTVWSPLFRVESGTQEALSKCFLSRWLLVWPTDVYCLWVKRTFRVVELGFLCFLVPSAAISQLFLY